MTDDARHQPTPPANAPDWDAIGRFLAGESSAEEAARISRWLDANPADHALVQRLQSDTPAVAANVDVESALGRVHQRMGQSSNAPHLTLERGARSGQWRKAAAMVSLAAAAVFIMSVVVLQRRPSATPAVVAAAHTYSTKTGQRDSILLADGSRVILGPDSRLTVPGDYGTGARTVALQGDGYFDVVHDAAKPFAVRVANAIVEDIGTTFTVESDAVDTTTVSVLAGSVRLRLNSSAPNAGAVLAAGDRGSLTNDGHVRTTEHASVTDDAAWTTGRLVFRDASMARVAGELRRWYGVSVHLADSSLRTRHITNTFKNGESIDQILRVLSLSLGVRVDRQGDSVTIHAVRGSASVR